MIPVSQALSIIQQNTGRIGTESVGLTGAVGRVLQEEIIADTDLPPFDRSQMDGYAVIASDTENAPVSLTVVGESSAGRGWHNTLSKGGSVRIMTGAPVPDGADAVQKVELTGGWESDSAQNDSGETVTILETTALGNNIVRRGAEVTKGDKIFSNGEQITPQMISVLAAFGYAEVRVSEMPRVGILATGSEIVPINETPGRDQIRNSNASMLDALAAKYHSIPQVFPLVGDDIGGLKDRIAEAASVSDVLLITGGVSVGKYDLTKPALRELGADILFEKVSLKPGKPTVFALLNGTLVFGLPGNPVSAAVTFELFVGPALRQLQGEIDYAWRTGKAVLENDTRATKGRDTYLPATTATDDQGHLTASPLRWQGSSDFIGYSRASALIEIPAGGRFSKGDIVRIIYL